MPLRAVLHDDEPALGPDFDPDAVSGAIFSHRIDECSLAVKHHENRWLPQRRMAPLRRTPARVIYCSREANFSKLIARSRAARSRCFALFLQNKPSRIWPLNCASAPVDYLG
jgi:hypothetical protein